MSFYAAKIESGVVVDTIVGDAEWAESRLGGEWAPSDVKVGIGWLLVNGEITPPLPDEEGS